MNLGQTLITMGMLVLLIISVISATRTLMDNNAATLQSEAMTAAATIGNDLLEEILSKKFDKWADSTGTQDKSVFSPPTGGNEWGPGGKDERDKVKPLPDTSSTGNYKSKIYFDDVDDYIGYSRKVTMHNISGFIASVNVFYCNSSAPDVPLNVQNTYKTIIVTVSHPLYLPEPISFSALISY